MMGVKRLNGIIMDEVDGMSSGDKGGMSELISFINPNKGLRKNKRKPVRYDNPIICISNEEYDKKINDLRKECEVIKFIRPKKTELYELVNMICREENKELSDEIIFKIIEHSQNDIRKLLGLLEFYFKNQSLEVEDFLKSQEKKNINSNLFDSTLKILTLESNKDNTLKIFSQFNLVLNQIIHENILTNYKNFKGTDNDKLDNLEENYNALCEGDKLDGKLYKDHVYNITDYLGYCSGITIANNLSKLERYQYLKENDIIYSRILSKFSIALNNFKLKSIFKKIFNVSNSENLNIVLEIYLKYFLQENPNIKIYFEEFGIEEIEKIQKIVKMTKVNSIRDSDIQINNIEKKELKQIYFNLK